jgi:hypothetical protein
MLSLLSFKRGEKLTLSALMLIFILVGYTATAATEAVPFTSAQATRGEALFRQHCSRCHSLSEFSGIQFNLIWRTRPVFDLYEKILLTMPMDQPGSLSSDHVSSLVSLILSENGYPAGPIALPNDSDSLKLLEL